MADQTFQRLPINPTCQACNEDLATHFCKCTDSTGKCTLTLLCGKCALTHPTKNTRALHQVLPIAELDQNSEEYMRKYETLMKATAELRRNTDKMEQCSTDFADMMQTCINYLTEYRHWWLQQIQTSKEELALAIETAIQEATAYLDQGVEPGSALGKAMWTFSTEELQVFKYTVSAPDLTTLCQTWAFYENDLKRLCLLAEERARPMPPVSVTPAQPAEANVSQWVSGVEARVQPQLVHVTKSYIRIFNFQRGGWKQPLPLNPHIQVDYTSTWVILEVGSILICGGGGINSAWGTAYLLREECVEQVESMQVGRCLHGVLAYNNQVYVFGGYNKGGLHSCEKHQWHHTWTLLPPMQAARGYFNPCLFNGSIYLCGSGSTRLEVFSPQSDQMLPFHLSMPISSNCCVYVEDNLLVVHLDKLILKYRVGQAEQLVQISTTSTEEDVKSPSSQPVVNAILRVYYVVVGSMCYCVNMETGATGPAIE